MNKVTQSCLRVCKTMLDRKFTEPVHDVFRQFRGFFKTHQALEAVYEIDPSNVNGTFWKFQERMLSDFLDWDKQDEANGRLRPILVKSEVEKDVFKALDILWGGFRRDVGDCKLEYYALSLWIPFSKLHHWVEPIEYYVVDKHSDMKELSTKIRIANSGERKVGTLPSASPEEAMAVQVMQARESKVTQRKIDDPFSSDKFGTLAGETGDPFTDEILRQKREKYGKKGR